MVPTVNANLGSAETHQCSMPGELLGPGRALMGPAGALGRAWGATGALRGGNSPSSLRRCCFWSEGTGHRSQLRCFSSSRVR